MISTIDRYASTTLLAFSTGIILGSLPLGVISLYAIPFALTASAIAAAAGSMVVAKTVYGTPWGWPPRTGLIATILLTLFLSGGYLLATVPMEALSFALIPIALGAWFGSLMAVLLSLGMKLTWALVKQVRPWVVFSISMVTVLVMTLLLSTQTPLFMIPCILSGWLLLLLKFKARSAQTISN